MGVHDYIDFVQGNGQCLSPLTLLTDADADVGAEEDDDGNGAVGSTRAILVRVPDSCTVRDILSWRLTDFAKYPVHEAKYSWDDWGFENVRGYRKILMGDSDRWWEQSIWRSPTFPGEWLVTFEPGTYAAFVRGEAQPELIPWWYYRCVFGSRPDSCPLNKKLAYKRIVDSGALNVREFDGTLNADNIPSDCANLDCDAVVPSYDTSAACGSCRKDLCDDCATPAAEAYRLREWLTVPNACIACGRITCPKCATVCFVCANKGKSYEDMLCRACTDNVPHECEDHAWWVCPKHVDEKCGECVATPLSAGSYAF
jgi:hypothetical protein